MSADRVPIEPANGGNSEAVRADVWLWAARFFKTRRLSHEAIDGGKVEVNAAACKPARALKVGDTVRISRGEERLEVEVLALSAKRGPASVAQTLYRETAQSSAARTAQREQQRLLGAAGPAHRPDKQARRHLRRLKTASERPCVGATSVATPFLQEHRG